METFKSTIFSILILAIFGGAIYWSITTMQSGSGFVADQRIKQLKVENENLKKELKNSTVEPAIVVSVQPDPVSVAPVDVKPQTENKPVVTPTTYKYQSLINEIQSLINKNITLKLKVTGTSVGTLQKFLNVYNKTSNKIDNDYGKSSQTLVIAFQKSQSLTANGEVNVTTFKKMIDWLKKQN